MTALKDDHTARPQYIGAMNTNALVLGAFNLNIMKSKPSRGYICKLDIIPPANIG